MVDRSTWTVQILADFIDEHLAQQNLRIEERYEADQKAIEAAFAANNARLDGMNEFRAAMSDQYARSVPRAEFEAEIRALQNRLEIGLTPIKDQLAAHGKPNWLLLGGFASVVLGVLSGCWLLIGLQINVAESPLTLALEGLKTNFAVMQTVDSENQTRLRSVEEKATGSIAADAESRNDRKQLNDRVSQIEASVAKEASDSLVFRGRSQVQLSEIETQFCASDIVRNLMHAADMRILSILWKDAHSTETLPSDNAYYPIICRRDGDAADTPKP